MHDPTASHLAHTRYQVCVGHITMVVDATCHTEAIRLARKKLSDEMPRLWDVIHRLDDRQFRIDLAHE